MLTASRTLATTALALLMGAVAAGVSPLASAADYTIDAAHSFVQFRIKHLGFSWLYGRFNEFSGTFKHDPADPAASRIEVEVQTASVDTNHAQRDKHLRSDDFLAVERHPTARFVATGYDGSAEAGVMSGELTLNGTTQPVQLQVEKLGEGPDPWGGHRTGFIATMTLKRADFGIDYQLGPEAETMEFELGIEGVRQ